jgi:hypothetical protein
MCAEEKTCTSYFTNPYLPILFISSNLITSGWTYPYSVDVVMTRLLCAINRLELKQIKMTSKKSIKSNNKRLKAKKYEV